VHIHHLVCDRALHIACRPDVQVALLSAWRTHSPLLGGRWRALQWSRGAPPLARHSDAAAAPPESGLLPQLRPAWQLPSARSALLQLIVLPPCTVLITEGSSKFETEESQVSAEELLL